MVEFVLKTFGTPNCGLHTFSRKSSLRGSGADGSSQSSILARALTASSAISRWAKLLVITKMASIHSTSSLKVHKEE